MKHIYIVWLHYPEEEKRFSAAFSNKEEAEKYAKPEADMPLPRTSVSKEPVYAKAEDVS